MNTPPLRIVAYFAASLADADYHLTEVDEVYSWPQTWGSTACGHPGIGGSAMTTGIVVVVLGRTHDGAERALVYSQGRQLHNVPRTPAVEYAIERRHVPGSREPWKEPPT